MAISVTEILGTDSLSGSRLVINDNFNILASEINAIGSFLNTQAGTINNINDLNTKSLKVGLTTTIIDANASGIGFFSNLSTNSDIIINGSGKLIRNTVNPDTLDDILAGSSLEIEVGTSTAIPPFAINRVGNGTVSDLSIRLHSGVIGQEIFFVYSKNTTGDVVITGAIHPIILPGGATKIELSTKGATAKLLCVDNGTGNSDWFLVGGTGYTLS